jgi:hypothetical protein
LPSRKERLEELAEHARKVINDHPTYDRHTIYQALEEHIILEWGSSQSTRKDYVISVAAMLKEELAKRDSDIEATIPKLDSNIGLLYGKPNIVSKERAFLEVLKGLAGPGNNDVEEKVLMLELNKTGKFSDEQDARTVLIRLSREGQILERRPGRWARS